VCASPAAAAKVGVRAVQTTRSATGPVMVGAGEGVGADPR
jgi:hypothetical protein